MRDGLAEFAGEGKGGMMLFALVVVAAQPAPPPAPDPCPLFARLIAAAQERPAFSSIRRALASGEAVVPGFAAAECRIEPVEALECSHRGMGAHGYPHWREPVACPGLTALPTPRRAFNRAFTVAAPGDLQIAYGVHCFQCAGPGTAWFRVGRSAAGKAEE